MEKLIIVNKTDLPMSTILRMANGVITMGRISDDGKSYCYVSTFEKDGVVCCAQKNKASDTLTFFKED